MTELLSKQPETNAEKRKSYQKYLIGAAAVIATALFIYHEAFKSKPDDQTNPVVSPTPENSRCTQTWEMTGFGHDNGDWVEGGINKYDEKGQLQNPRDVLDTWLKSVDKDNSTLEYLAETVYKSSDNSVVDVDPTKLVTSDGCASDSAVSLNEYLKDKLSKAEVSYGLAPTTGSSSYVDEHNEIQKSKVSSDRESIVIDFKNGNFLYVLMDCGNLVTTDIEHTEQKTVIIRHKTKVIEKHEHENKKKLTKKSSDPNDYEQLGSGSENNSGSGLKNHESADTSAESNPPQVETKSSNQGVINNGTVTD